jgi:hypothetical protein
MLITNELMSIIKNIKKSSFGRINKNVNLLLLIFKKKKLIFLEKTTNIQKIDPIQRKEIQLRK